MNNQNLHIEQLSKGIYLVIAKNSFRPEFYLDAVNKLIQRDKEISVLYFDLLLKNGLKDRFYKAETKNHKVNLASFESIQPAKDIEDKSNLFFAKNMHLITNSYLSAAQKFLLRKSLLVEA